MTTMTADAAPAPTHAELDQAIEELTAGERVWSRMSLGQRVTLLRAVRTQVGAVAAEWARTAAASKGLDESHPLRGEEWLSGPYSVLGALDASIETLQRLDRGGSPLDGVKLSRAPGGRVRVH